jgi:hypothetical protein
MDKIATPDAAAGGSPSVPIPGSSRVLGSDEESGELLR